MRAPRQRSWSWLLQAGIVALLLCPLAYALARWGSTLRVDPPRFTEEYLKFLGRIGGIYLGFILVHVVVASRQSHITRTRTNQMARRGVDEIIMAWQQLKRLLEQGAQDQDAAINLQVTRESKRAFIESEVRQLLRFLESEPSLERQAEGLVRVRAMLRRTLLPLLETAAHPLGAGEVDALDAAVRELETVRYGQVEQS